MSPHASSGQGACPGGCKSCHAALPPSPEPTPFEGVSFGFIAFGYFIIPIISAILGSHYLGTLGANFGALGAVGGLIAGALGCALVARRFFHAKPRRYTGGLS